MPLVRMPDGGGNSLLLMEFGNRGYKGPPVLPEEQLANTHNIPIRDDDVILLSYPKSGCHWLWEIARMIQAGTTNVPVVEKDKYMMEFNSIEEMEKLPSPRIFNTHFLFHQLPEKVQQGKVKLLFIYRNPKDVAVSFFNHHTKFHVYKYQGKFSDYLTGLYLPGDTDFGGYFPYARHWEDVFEKNPHLEVFTVSYEQLHQNTFQKVKELAKFLECSVSEDTLGDIVDKCSIGSMRERKGQELIKNYGEAVMYRKGKVGDWKNWFTVAQSEMFDEVCAKEMKGSKFQLLYTIN